MECAGICVSLDLLPSSVRRDLLVAGGMSLVGNIDKEDFSRRSYCFG